MKRMYKILVLSLLFSFVLSEDYKTNKEDRLKNKNMFASMLMSAVIPGSGQIYNGNWKRGLAYLGIEIFSLSRREKYKDDSDRYVQLYENYADEHWSIQRWLEDFYIYKDPGHSLYNHISAYPIGNEAHGPSFYYNGNLYEAKSGTLTSFSSDYESVCANAMANYNKCDLYIYVGDQNNNNIKDDEDYTVVWGEIQVDNNVPELVFNNVQLLKDHHLYEGIGKYNVFFAGWDDALIHGSIITKNNNQVAVSPNKNYYQYLRNRSNSESDKAELFLTTIFINHAVSILDALLTHTINKRNLESNSNVNYGVDYLQNKKELSFKISW